MELLPHQMEDAAFLASSPGVKGNFSGMGSGKTLTALEAAAHVCDACETVLIVAPPIALRMWAREYEAWVGGDAQIIKTGKSKLNYDATAFVMSYDIARKRVDELKALGAKVLICDESHALKSTSAKRTQAILGKGGLVESVEYAWMLTGTPSTAWNDDLFAFLCRAGYERLEAKIGRVTEDRFKLRYCVTQSRKFHRFQKIPTIITVGNRNTEELRDMIYGKPNPLAVRRKLEDVWKDMPPFTETRYEVPLKMDDELKEMLKNLSKMHQQEIDEGLRQKDEHLASIRQKIGIAKVPAFADVIAERIDDGLGPILIGAWHREVITSLRDRFINEGLDVGLIYGGTSKKNDAEVEDAFNAKKIDVLVGQIAAMGVSLNLQHGGHHIAVIEEDWSPDIMDQFYARLMRMGQKNHVHADIFFHDNKIDNAVHRISKTKDREHKKLNDAEAAR